MAAEKDSAQDKTEEATPKRREDARREGQILQSRELASFLVMALPSAALLIFGRQIMEGLALSMEMGLTVPRSVIFGEQSVLEHVAGMMTPLSGLLLLLLLGVVAGIASSAMLGGIVLNADLAGFRFNRMDPIAGLGRMFGLQALVELAKGLLKAVWLLGVLALILWWDFTDIMSLSSMDLAGGVRRTVVLTAVGLLLMALATALITAIDVPWQMWDHGQKLRMSLQEVRDELKETDGRPELKARQRQVAQELSRRRMMEDVKTADVVVTNPTHYSVALRYSPESGTAPVVVAKGRNEIALRIREVAVEARVPLLEQPPLARALYFHTPIGAEIPASLYAAVAQILAFVFQLKVRGMGPRVARQLPQVAVPPGMDREEIVE